MEEFTTHFTHALENFVNTLAESPTGWFWSGVILVGVFIATGLMLKSLEWRSRSRWILFLVLSSLGGLGTTVLMNTY